MEKKRMNDKETLCRIKSELIERLEELKEITEEDENQFAYGEKTAYTECLEWIQENWRKANKNGLHFDIEDKYPL